MAMVPHSINGIVFFIVFFIIFSFSFLRMDMSVPVASLPAFPPAPDHRFLFLSLQLLQFFPGDAADLYPGQAAFVLRASSVVGQQKSVLQKMDSAVTVPMVFFRLKGRLLRKGLPVVPTHGQNKRGSPAGKNFCLFFPVHCIREQDSTLRKQIPPALFSCSEGCWEL